MDRFIHQLASEVGRTVLGRFGIDGMHYMKSDSISDVVTAADLMADALIVELIEDEYPEHGIISEESGNHNEGAEYVWVVDPIDGSLNFSRGIPCFGVMICLVHRGEVIHSAINLPATDDLYFANAGMGAYRNGKRIHCSQQQTLDKSFGCGSSKNIGRSGMLTRQLLASAPVDDIQYGSFGAMSVNVAAVASGGRDWIVPLTGKIWDFAPSYLMLKEAGCTVTDCKGNPWKFGTLEMVAANPVLHAELLTITKDL